MDVEGLNESRSFCRIDCRKEAGSIDIHVYLVYLEEFVPVHSFCLSSIII